MTNIINKAGYGVFQKPKTGQEGTELSTENFPLKKSVKMQNLAKAFELGLRENGIIISL
ncbi:hypothetical protein [Microcoleus sp. BROC3]|uniref:hypothetical protein n=1 Tax=Microcoleus sp. BROC3 TaxID=3055323 RepID=UPI002FD66580